MRQGPGHRRRRPDRILEATVAPTREDPAYPAHLRLLAETLPAAPGIYVFEGAPGDLPLYIGKSVNLRSRVLAHLRNGDEAAMLRQARSIGHERTTGEIGALLLEARRIKERQPLYNQRLRRSRQLCSLRIRDGRPQVVYARDLDFGRDPDLYGLFGSRHAALERLRALAGEQRLCLGALGLETVIGGRGCFRAALGLCAGLCRNEESPHEHAERLLAGLRPLHLACWPYAQAIGIVERDGAAQQIHVVRNWCYLGSVASLAKARRLDTVAAGFDADSYKILCGPILAGRHEIVGLNPAA